MDTHKASRRLKYGRRIAINVNLTPEIHEQLFALGKGNRSAAIEELVKRHVARHRLEPVT
jgi:hypothetical protein